MRKKMNEREKECMDRLNEVIETGDYVSGLSFPLGGGGMSFVDKNLNAILKEYGKIASIDNEKIVGVGKIVKIIIV